MTTTQTFAAEMARLGLDATSPWDLVNRKARYPAGTVEALLTFLDPSGPEDDTEDGLRFREGVVRALAVKDARGQADQRLVAEFERPGVPDLYRWAVGNTLYELASPPLAPELIRLATDRRYGFARQMVVLGLGPVRVPTAVPVLISLLDHPDVNGHALSALGRLGDPEGREALEPFLVDPRGWVRAEARRAIGRLNRAPPGM